MTKLLISICQFLETSPAYGRAKHLARILLEDPHSNAKRAFELGMILIVLISVVLLVYAVENPVTPWMRWFEDCVVTLFILEYLARLWIIDDLHSALLEHYRQARYLQLPFRPGRVLWASLRRKWAYMCTPMAIIDLLAILPSYRPARLLRVFVVFRLFKLFRYARSMQGIAEALSERRFEFYTLAFFMIFVVLAAASAIYAYEGPIPDSPINTFADAVYWAMVTLSTVGYGDIVPLTPEGRAVAMALIVAGIAVLAFSTSIVVAAFQEKLRDLHDQRVFSELEHGRRYTILCGFGEVGQVVAAKLAQAKERFLVIEIREETARQAAQLGYLTLQGDGADNDLLESVGVRNRAHTLICVTADDVKNVFITISARRMNPGLRIIARADNQQVARKLTLAGANHVVSPPQVVGLMGAEYIGCPVAFDAIYGILRGELDIRVEALRVSADAPLHGHTLEEIDFARRKILLFGVITAARPEGAEEDHLYALDGDYWFMFKTAPGYRVDAGDVLVLFGYAYSIAQLRHEISDDQPARWMF